MLIPTVLSLSDFFASNFPHISWYPYWYLGTPFYYLIGPVVPILLKIFNFQFSIFNLYLSLIGLSFILGAAGIYFLLREFQTGRKQAITSTLLYILIPAGFYLLNYQNGLNHIAFASLPLILLLFKRFLEKGSVYQALGLSTAIAFALLISVSILLPLIVGFVAILISLRDKGNWEDLAIKTCLIILLGISLATTWYTPGFWWITLTNPSFGGEPLGKLLINLFKLLLNLIPVIFAILVVKIKRFKPKGLMLFAWVFFGSFLFLSIIRFLSDPDFVMDWIGFGLELQFGGAILLGSIVQSSKFKVQSYSLKFIIFALVILASLILDLMVVKSWLGIDQNYQNRVVEILKNIPDNERVFLSGSSVFWINSKLNLNQLRGGIDQAAIHPFWAHAAYQIREGDNTKLSEQWLRALGTKYILVHEKSSQEPFHDFKHPEKFSQWQFVAGEKYDKLYKINTNIVRKADQNILSVQKPKNGVDERVVSEYIVNLKEPLNSKIEHPNQIFVEGDFQKGEVISLAISFHPGWVIISGQGKIGKDSLGNLVIIPQIYGQEQFRLKFQESLINRLLPLIFSIIILAVYLNFSKLSSKINKISLSLGFEEDDE